MKAGLGLFRGIHIPQAESGPSQNVRGPWAVGWLVFMGWVISYANEWEEYSNCLGEGVGISPPPHPRIGAPPTFWLLMVCLGTVMAPVGVSLTC